MTSKIGSAERPTEPSERSVPALLVLIVLLSLATYGAFSSSVPIMFVSALVGACVLPRNSLPPMALWLVVLLPVSVMTIPTPLSKYFSPAVLVIAIWAIRLAVGQRALLLRVPLRGWLIIPPLFLLLFVSALGSGRTDLTMAWVAVLTLCVVAPAILGQIATEDIWPGLLWAFAGIGIFLGLLSAAEFFLDFNPWASLIRYDISSQTWSTFRARASLGHPLTMSTAASVTLVACLFPGGDKRLWWQWAGAFGALVAVILSVSRSSVFAIGIAAVVGLFAVRASSRAVAQGKRSRWGSLFLAGGLISVVAFSPLLARRSDSSEGLGSAEYRSDILRKALDLITDHPLVGYGPGTSYVVYAQHYASSIRIGRLENSVLQLIISIGIPASLLSLIGLGIMIGIALKRSRPGVAAGMVAFFVTIAGYNALDVNPALLAFVAPLIYCAMMPITDVTATANAYSLVHSSGRRS
ncbi:O-antigen ligase family protein [Mycolicibacterium helvum]|uniref:O-antigen ligase-related domain-containing protein n=1 Tax=Mycolicibacterium helvum TaxID=1534349 RepID=A0A7I7T154_9MYCO|nr:O-antigen ligase family protein [Mycolicibacterium helvum]BBY63022.1 hypothetical protein MHEL_12650 [Mycolicibacterium helvum]